MRACYSTGTISSHLGWSMIPTGLSFFFLFKWFLFFPLELVYSVLSIFYSTAKWPSHTCIYTFFFSHYPPELYFWGFINNTEKGGQQENCLVQHGDYTERLKQNSVFISNPPQKLLYMLFRKNKTTGVLTVVQWDGQHLCSARPQI